MKKFSIIAAWLFVLLLGPIIVLSKTPIAVVSGNTIQLINLLQRLSALMAFSAIFAQIVIGANISKLFKVFGSWIRKFHIFQGVIAYFLVLIHPLIYVLFNYKLSGSLDPFYVFTDICVLCARPYELHYSIGRIAFWLVTLAILAAVARGETWWKKNWRKFHILNYFVFFLLSAHAWFVGTDLVNASFVYIFWIETGIVLLILIQKLVILIIRLTKFKNIVQ